MSTAVDVRAGIKVSQPRNPYACRVVLGSKNDLLPTPNLYIYSIKDYAIPAASEGEEVPRGGFELVGQIVDAQVYNRQGFMDRQANSEEKNEVNLRITLSDTEGNIRPVDITLADLAADNFNGIGLQTLALLANIGHHEDENFKNHYFQFSFYSKQDGERAYPRLSMRYPVDYDANNNPVFEPKATLRLDELPPRPKEVTVEGARKPVLTTSHILDYLNEMTEAVRQIWPETRREGDTFEAEGGKGQGEGGEEDGDLADELDTEGLGEDLAVAPATPAP